MTVSDCVVVTRYLWQECSWY